MGHPTGSSSSSFLRGWISPRSATLALAILGIIVHLNAFSWLGTLSSTLPDVPERQLPAIPEPGIGHIPDKYANSAARIDQLVDLGTYNHNDESQNENIAAAVAAAGGLPGDTPLGAIRPNPHLPEWIAEAKAYLKAQGLSFVPSSSQRRPDSSTGKSSSSSGGVKDSSGNNGDSSLPYQTMEDDGAEDVERMQWDALRLVIHTLRWYILLSVICCAAGVIGVLRSQLLLSRLFVIHSFLDLLLSTLSLFAIALVCTYPNVRSHLCDEFGSGDLQSWFSHKDGNHQITSASQRLNSASGIGGSGSAAGALAQGGAMDVDVGASGWETMLDGVFGSENCEESFRTTVVPLLMLFGLFFTALRLQCFFMVQRFYASLLRTKVHQYGYGNSSTAASGASTPMSTLPLETRDRRWKEDKLLD